MHSQIGLRVLRVPAAPAATACDFDFDGDVDLADYLTVQACFSGAGVPVASGCERADLDHDGDVDLADLLEVQAHFTGAR